MGDKFSAINFCNIFSANYMIGIYVIWNYFHSLCYSDLFKIILTRFKHWNNPIVENFILKMQKKF